MLEIILGICILTGLMFTETLLSAKMANPLWGGIIPLLCLGVTAAVFLGGVLPAEIHSLFPFIMVNVLFLGNWATMRDQRKKILRARQQQKEAQAGQP